MIKDKTEFRGLHIGNLEINIGEKRKKVVRDWPKPETISELWSFSGLFWFFWRFILGFLKTAASLFNLTEKRTHHGLIKQQLRQRLLQAYKEAHKLSHNENSWLSTPRTFPFWRQSTSCLWDPHTSIWDKWTRYFLLLENTIISREKLFGHQQIITGPTLLSAKIPKFLPRKHIRDPHGQSRSTNLSPQNYAQSSRSPHTWHSRAIGCYQAYVGRSQTTHVWGLSLSWVTRIVINNEKIEEPTSTSIDLILSTGMTKITTLTNSSKLRSRALQYFFEERSWAESSSETAWLYIRRRRSEMQRKLACVTLKHQGSLNSRSCLRPGQSFSIH